MHLLRFNLSKLRKVCGSIGSPPVATKNKDHADADDGSTHDQPSTSENLTDDVAFEIPDFNGSVNKFIFPDWLPYYDQSDVCVLDGQLYKWIWVNTLPQHALCRQYMEEYRSRRDALPPETLRPVQLWSVREFNEMHKSDGAAFSAVDFLQKWGQPFHSRCHCVPIGHAEPRDPYARSGEMYGPVRRQRPNRSYHSTSATSSAHQVETRSS